MLKSITSQLQDVSSKGEILNQLAACVASAVDADDYNLYILGAHPRTLVKYDPLLVTGSSIASLEEAERWPAVRTLQRTATDVRGNSN